MRHINPIQILVLFFHLTIPVIYRQGISLLENVPGHVSIDQIIKQVHKSQTPDSNVDQVGNNLRHLDIYPDVLFSSLALYSHLCHQGVPVRSF